MRAFEVLVGFSAAGIANIREGMSGEVSIRYAYKENVLTVPLSALRYLDGKEFLMVASSKSATPDPKSVGVGLKTETEAEILSGVSAADYFVIEKTIQ